MARSYEQFCGLARALDVVGERWTLLIVRELLIRPARYAELAAALPGIASNLLADRLRALVVAGVVEQRKDAAGRGIYALTAWGMQLEDAVGALVRWSTPLMRPGPGSDAFQPQWLRIALVALLRNRARETPIEVAIHTAGVTLTVRLDESGPHVEPAQDPPPETELRASPDVVLGLAAGALSVEQAVARGELRGDPDDLAGVFTAGSATGAPTASVR